MSGISKYLQNFILIKQAALKDGLPLGKINGDFATKFIWTFLFVYSLAGEIFYLTIAKMNLTKSPQFFDQLKGKYIPIFALSANTFQSDQIQVSG